MNPTVLGRALFEGEVGKIIQCDRAHDLKTFRADLIHCVLGGVPRRKIEINQVNRCDAGGIQWRMIIENCRLKVGEVIAQLQRFGRGKNVERHLRRRIR